MITYLIQQGGRLRTTTIHELRDCFAYSRYQYIISGLQDKLKTMLDISTVSFWQISAIKVLNHALRYIL